MPKSNAEKLGITPGSTLTVINSPDDQAVLGALPDGVTLSALAAENVADVILVFADDSAQLKREVPPVLAKAPDTTKVWIAHRKGKASDLGRDSLMPAFVDLGWHGVSLISLDAAWSAARFRRIEQIGR